MGVLDVSETVYRLGYGDPGTLSMLDGAARHRATLRQHDRLRISVVVADSKAMVFSPIAALADAGAGDDEGPLHGLVLHPVPEDPVRQLSGQANGSSCLVESVKGFKDHVEQKLQTVVGRAKEQLVELLFLALSE